MPKYGAIRSVVNSGKYVVAELDLYKCGVTDVLGDFGFIETYKEAGYKPYVIAAMILSNRFANAPEILEKLVGKDRKRIKV